MRTDESDEQDRNTAASRDESCDWDSKVTLERDSHPMKHSWPSRLTEKGRQIDETDEHLRNADSSMEASLESDSNVTVERE
jgi:hypothetical protein